MNIRVIDIAHARSGDKGDMANIGVIARKAEWYPLLERYLTVVAVAKHFAPLTSDTVLRYEIANLWALNFLLHGILDGGGTRSLKADAQGKVLSTALLRLVLEIPDDVAAAAGVGATAAP